MPKSVFVNFPPFLPLAPPSSPLQDARVKTADLEEDDGHASQALLLGDASLVDLLLGFRQRRCRGTWRLYRRSAGGVPTGTGWMRLDALGCWPIRGQLYPLRPLPMVSKMRGL